MSVSTLIFRVLHQHRRGILGWTLGIVAIVAVQLGVYPTIRSSASDWAKLTDSFPDAIKQIFRMEDYTSERGYLSAELMSFTVPFIVMGFGCSWGARVGTEEEEMGTSDLILSLPISRRRYLVSRITASVLALGVLLGLFALALVIGSRALEFSIPLHAYASAVLSLFLIGFLMMSIAIFIGAWKGKRTIALGLAMACAIAAFVLYSLGPLVSFIDATMPYNPMQWTIGSQPLSEGTSPWNTLWAGGIGFFFLVAAVALFERRDLAG
ncbi:unannotated protein [freshwater metagenome]|uniref:Unannotated protein n=1 Tax=freshwater metagenome TaxID=449393 RepID=A0A6J6KNJ8_9ZZZZ|nr:ABC transporter permease subunit [Actinomycetota bacterium]MTA93033.1 ABC transporter permease subunit [Actinomycetota bacterium]